MKNNWFSKLNKATFMALFLLTPVISSAQIKITEIMYNLEGSDSGREWIEICNSGAETVDLSGWKFFENGSNHGLTLVSGSLSLLSGGSAVIASNDVKFMIDWPDFNGNLFDSAFSLSNTGELLEIRNSELIMQNSVTYSSEWGADGDGKTLNSVNGVFTSDVATPGTNSCVIGQTKTNNNTDDAGVWIKTDEKISVNAGDDMVVVVGSEVEFESYAEGFVGEELIAERYLWNFGDGFTKEGVNVTHSYSHVGKYTAVVDVISGRSVASDRIDVIVVPSNIFISEYVEGDDGYVEITNNTEYELNISGWYLSAGDVDFVFPKNSFITNISPIRFSNSATRLVDAETFDIKLLFPNGTEVVFNDEDLSSHKPSIDNKNNDKEYIALTDDVHLVNMAQEKGENDITEGDSLNEDLIDSDIEKYPLQDHVAAVGSLDKSVDILDDGIGKWLTTLILLIIISSGGIVFIRREDDSIDES